MSRPCVTWPERPAPAGKMPGAPRSCARLVPTLFACLTIPFVSSCDEKTSPESRATAPASPAAAPTDWPLTRGGPQLQGRVHAAAPTTPAIEWTFELESPGNAEAAVAGGAILVGDVMGILYCIDIESRQLRWKMETGDTIHAAPAIAGDRVFVGSGDGKFHALELTTGEEIWTIEGNDKFSSAPMVVTSPDDGARWVLVNGYDGITRCLLAADGSEVWTYKTDDFINGTPAVIDGRFVAFGGCDKVVHILNLADGKPVNKVETDSQITNSVATSGTMIYCGNHANQVIAADAEGGTPAWIYQPNEFPFFSAPAVDDARVYIGSRDKSLHAIHRGSGEAAWTFPTGGRVESPPLAFNDAIVFGSSDGRLYAVDPADGTEIWRLDLGEQLTAAPAFAMGRLIIAGGDGTLFIIAASR